MMMGKYGGGVVMWNNVMLLEAEMPGLRRSRSTVVGGIFPTSGEMILCLV